jgi:heavy-metal-associated domain-containing protein
MKPYVHHILGRLRVRTERFRHDETATARLMRQLEAIEGVQAVDFHRSSSSLIVRYDSATDAGVRVLWLLSRRGDVAPGQTVIAKQPQSLRQAVGGSLIRDVRHAAVTSAATFLVEAAVIRLAPPAALLLLPVARKLWPSKQPA